MSNQDKAREVGRKEAAQNKQPSNYDKKPYQVREAHTAAYIKEKRK